MKSVKLNELLVLVFNQSDLNSHNLYETLEDIYQEIRNHDLFIMDFSNIRHFNTEAIGSLIYVQKYIEDMKKSLRIFQTKEQIRDVYKKLHLETVMSMTNDASKNDTDNTIFYFN
jgi:anti-anti-sigma regulatory factor